jgi:peptidyl-prolyl cis-trans isomerase SurA
LKLTGKWILGWGVAGLLASPAAAAERLERIVARVNDSIITQSALDARVEMARKDPTAPPDEKKVRIAVLEQMIRDRLIEDKAAVLELSASEAEVDEALDRVKEQYGLKSDEDFNRALASNGMTREGLRGQLRQSILTNKVLSREVPAALTDDVVRTEYERVKEKLYGVPEKATVSEIVVRFDPRDSSSQEAARARIAESQARLKAGTPFADVAREISEGPSRDRGGALGVVSRGDLSPELDAAVFGGDLSQPVVSRDAIHLLAVTAREKSGFRPFDDVKEEIRKRMSEEIYDKKFNEYLRDLRKAAFVKIFDADLAAADEAWNQKSQG